ncbi:MAG: RNA polymerase sigma factor [Puniceicoccaceae bacterium]
MEDGDSDEVLLRRMASGDVAALSSLMKRHKNAVFRFAYRYLHHESDAAEVTEQTFLRVYQNAVRFTPRAAVKTWMFSITRNLAMDSLRRNRKHRVWVPLHSGDSKQEDTAALIDVIESQLPQPSESTENREMLGLFHQKVTTLPEKLRFPFVFCVLEGHSHDECAEVLRTSRKTIETRIYRARMHLKKELSSLFH